MPAVAPLQFLPALFACVVSRHPQRVIDYLVEENGILKKLLGEQRVQCDDDTRRRLAILGKALGRVDGERPSIRIGRRYALPCKTEIPQGRSRRALTAYAALDGSPDDTCREQRSQ